ncbi:MAG: YebC/PmpR family DNA-binding transcriptional regulator [Elusimicrobia bacterium]|nr:YebC/PmpR family DNA-binding transcriptional regulator [Elusimicrobiota bacterium]
MGGHSHWAGIKHKKALLDSKRGKVWTRIVREITIAARMGGGDPGGNPRLRKSIEDAKAANMPAENVKRAIQKGTGEIPGVTYEELTWEGYGPAGVAIYCESTTDSRNRTSNEVRKVFENNGGKMGSPGSVSFLFPQKGYITVKKSASDEDSLMSLALDNGAEDFKSESKDVYEIITEPADFEKVKTALAEKKVATETAELTRIPTTQVKVDGPDAEKVLKLIDALEAHEDIKDVYANFDIPDQVLAQLEK